MTLEDFRKQWERNLEVKTEIKPFPDELLVVLEDLFRKEGDRHGDGDFYRCHRYFKVGDTWSISVDGQGVKLEQVWGWLKNPRALSIKY